MNNKPEINFLLGFSRSGTSIVMSYLRAHSQIETGYEEPNHLWRLMGHLKYKEDYAKNLNVPGKYIQGITDKSIRIFVETFYAGLSSRTGKRRIVLKHPWLVPYINDIYRIFPDAKFIILWRHPYDVIASTMDFAKNDNVAKEMFGTKLSPIVSKYKRHVEFLFKFSKKHDYNKVLNVKFEDFIKTPKQTLAIMFDFLGAGTDSEELLDISNGKGVVKTARVLDNLKIITPKRKFFEMSSKHQGAIAKSLSKYAHRLGYDTMTDIMRDEEK